MVILTMTVCYYHVTYAFPSESTLYTCLNVKERFAQNRRNIWSLSGSNRIATHNHLVCKQSLNHLAKHLYTQPFMPYSNTSSTQKGVPTEEGGLLTVSAPGTY